MMQKIAAVAMTLALASHAHGKPSTKSRLPAALPPPVAVRPLQPLPMLPRVARVRVEAARDRIVVIEDVQLPRGDWRSGGLDLYVAFGSPGTPLAIDARLIAPSPGGVEGRSEEPEDRVALERAPRRTALWQPLLGRGQMAGVVAHVKEAQLRRAYAVGESALLRIRSLLIAPAADATGARDVVVRLGVSDGQPLTLGRIQVGSLEAEPWLARAEAVLCGPEATSWPLTVAIGGKIPGSPMAAPSATLAPELAVRHTSDDLCIRWWGLP